MTSRSDNAPRLKPGTDHVESWFLRANDPASPRAVWVKATALVRANGESVAEAWCSVFDHDRARGFRATVPLGQARLVGDADRPTEAEVAGTRLQLELDGGRAEGGLRSETGAVAWDLRFRRFDGPLGDPLCLLPDRRLIDARLPRNKLLTPFPVALFEGTLSWDDATWDLGGWVGMQGHNWGPAHAPEYAWGQAVFLDASGAPFAMVEAASGRVVVGPFTTPVLSLLTARRGEREFRFDHILDLWNQRPRAAFPDWTLGMSGKAGEALLTMRAAPERTVCLGYDNPTGPRGLCLNSKTAGVVLRLNPNEEDGFELLSPHGGALEFLQRHEDSRVLPVV